MAFSNWRIKSINCISSLTLYVCASVHVRHPYPCSYRPADKSKASYTFGNRLCLSMLTKIAANLSSKAAADELTYAPYTCLILMITITRRDLTPLDSPSTNCEALSLCLSLLVDCKGLRSLVLQCNLSGVCRCDSRSHECSISCSQKD